MCLGCQLYTFIPRIIFALPTHTHTHRVRRSSTHTHTFLRWLTPSARRVICFLDTFSQVVNWLKNNLSKHLSVRGLGLRRATSGDAYGVSTLVLSLAQFLPNCLDLLLELHEVKFF